MVPELSSSWNETDGGDLAFLPPAAGAEEVILAPLVVIQKCQWLAEGKEEVEWERKMGKVTLSAI